MNRTLLVICRLQEYCEKLLFYCPLEYGRKAEELLWRKAFYEIIQLMKHNRKVSHSFVVYCLRADLVYDTA